MYSAFAEACTNIIEGKIMESKCCRELKRKAETIGGIYIEGSSK
jgi:hypothetical protein